jgi:hypothetical protein
MKVRHFLQRLHRFWKLVGMLTDGQWGCLQIRPQKFGTPLAQFDTLLYKDRNDGDKVVGAGRLFVWERDVTTFNILTAIQFSISVQAMLKGIVTRV